MAKTSKSRPKPRTKKTLTPKKNIVGAGITLPAAKRNTRSATSASVKDANTTKMLKQLSTMANQKFNIEGIVDAFEEMREDIIDTIGDAVSDAVERPLRSVKSKTLKNETKLAEETSSIATNMDKLRNDTLNIRMMMKGVQSSLKAIEGNSAGSGSAVAKNPNSVLGLGVDVANPAKREAKLLESAITGALVNIGKKKLLRNRVGEGLLSSLGIIDPRKIKQEDIKARQKEATPDMLKDLDAFKKEIRKLIDDREFTNNRGNGGSGGGTNGGLLYSFLLTPLGRLVAAVMSGEIAEPIIVDALLNNDKRLVRPKPKKLSPFEKDMIKHFNIPKWVVDIYKSSIMGEDLANVLGQKARLQINAATRYVGLDRWNKQRHSRDVARAKDATPNASKTLAYLFEDERKKKEAIENEFIKTKKLTQRNAREEARAQAAAPKANKVLELLFADMTASKLMEEKSYEKKHNKKVTRSVRDEDRAYSTSPKAYKTFSVLFEDERKRKEAIEEEHENLVKKGKRGVRDEDRAYTSLPKSALPYFFEENRKEKERLEQKSTTHVSGPKNRKRLPKLKSVQERKALDMRNAIPGVNFKNNGPTHREQLPKIDPTTHRMEADPDKVLSFNDVEAKYNKSSGLQQASFNPNEQTNTNPVNQPQKQLGSAGLFADRMNGKVNRSYGSYLFNTPGQGGGGGGGGGGGNRPQPAPPGPYNPDITPPSPTPNPMPFVKIDGKPVTPSQQKELVEQGVVPSGPQGGALGPSLIPGFIPAVSQTKQYAGLDENSKLSQTDNNKTITSLGLSGKEWNAFRQAMVNIESGGGNYSITGGSSGRFSGAYQFGAAEIRETAKRLGIDPPTRAEFLANPAMQEQFFDEYTLSHHEQLMKNKRYRDASPEEKLKILGYAHNQGAGGASKWLNTGISGSDAFGTSGTKYYNNIGKQLDKTRNDKDILFEGKVTPQIDWTSKSVPKGMSDGDARTTAFAIASSMKGAKEGPDKKTLIEFLKKGGVNMDPETSAWCAAFVNASLMQSGVKGSGSQLAKSFEKWGNPTKTPQKGDVVVLKFGNGRQHVGFFDSFNPDGSVNVLGGNQGNSVSIKRYNINSVVGFRNVPQLQSKEQKKTPAASPPKPITSTTNQEQTTHITKKKSHTKSPKKNDFVSTNKYESPHRPLDNADKIKPVPSAPKIEPVPPTAPTPAAQSPHPMKQEVVPQKINASVGTNPLPVSYVKANIRAKNKENKVAPPTNPQGLYGISFDMG